MATSKRQTADVGSRRVDRRATTDLVDEDPRSPGRLTAQFGSPQPLDAPPRDGDQARFGFRSVTTVSSVERTVGPAISVGRTTLAAQRPARYGMSGAWEVRVGSAATVRRVK